MWITDPVADECLREGDRQKTMVSTAMHDLHPSSYVPEQPDTFRQIMAPLPTVKIDVEGSDLQMMRGSRRVLPQWPIIDLLLPV